MAAELHLENLILTILSNNNEKRRASEIKLQAFVDSSPSSYIESSLNLLQCKISLKKQSFYIKMFAYL